MAARVPRGSPAAGPSYASPGTVYPPYPSSEHPSDNRRRTIFPQPAVQSDQGFYNAALSTVGFAPPSGPSSYVLSPLSAYPPPSPLGPDAPYIPTMLKPGSMDRRSSSNNLRTNSGDLFFQSQSAFPVPRPHFNDYPPATSYTHRHHHQQPPQSYLPPPVTPQLRHSQSTPPPPLPNKSFNSPPIPPKPYGFASDSLPALPIYPQSISTSQSLRSQEVQSAPAAPDPSHYTFSRPGYESTPDEGIDFRRAVELSTQSALENARMRQKTLTQEDEDFARALQESLQPSMSMSMPIPRSPADDPVHMPIPSPSKSSSDTSHQQPPPSMPSSSRHYAHDDDPLTAYTSSPPTMLSQISEDEALARRLAEEEGHPSLSPAPPLPPLASHSVPYALPAIPSSSVTLPASSLASSSIPHSPSDSYHAPGDIPPMYNEVVALVLPDPGPSGPTASPSLLSAAPGITTSDPSPAHSRPNSAIGRSTSATAVPPSASPSNQPDVRTGRSSSFGSAHTASAGSLHTQSIPTTPDLDSKSTSPTNGTSLSAVSHLLSPVAEATENGRPRSSSHASDSAATPAGNANQYIDQELLRGVSLGFNPPVIRSDLTPLQGPIPNVIALPYGRCPPFHLKAPSWRDLIKLMARLSGTRLEPTIEAMAVVKTEMRVRVVVNFIKVHQNTSDWHVVLYMTIDQPVPQNHPQKFRYKNGDPSILPFSYTMSATPAYLREGADAPISKWYSIPATSSLPHPKLPITFPDLATYLLDALEDSRKVLHDGSSGMRRLAKLVETCYPADREERPGRERGVGGWVRGLIGRERQRSRDRNEHTFDVVTPFVPDEWGG